MNIRQDVIICLQVYVLSGLIRIIARKLVENATVGILRKST